MLCPQMYLGSDYLREQGLSDSFPLRFIAKIEFKGPDDCWIWIGSTRPASRLHPEGHGMIQRMEGRNWKIYAHRAAYILWRGPVPEGKIVCHCCPAAANPLCCNPKHLYLGTHATNAQDTLRENANYFQTHSFQGEKHGMAKLTPAQVDEIRRAREAGTILRVLASEYGVSVGHIHHVCSGRAWKHRNPNDTSKL